MIKVIAAKKIIAIVSAALVLAACQPTPEKPVVVNKGDGKLEESLQRTQPPGETAKRYEAPERLDMEMEGLQDGYRIVFDAEVVIPDQTKWPVYVLEPADITQEQADAVRSLLVGDAVLYKPGEYRSREEIQRSIDGYEEELRLSEGYPDLIEAYQKILKDLYIEYERTPENIVLEKADTNFKFMEERLRPEWYGGEEVITGEDSYKYEWTDEARRTAIEAGCENIYGICWMDNGRKMEFSASKGDHFKGMHFGIEDGKPVREAVVTYSLEEAEARGAALLEAMGLDFALVCSKTSVTGERNEQDEFVETGMAHHTLIYKRNIQGAPQDCITSVVDQNVEQIAEAEFRRPVRSETITIKYDDYGVQSFYWENPTRVVSMETENALLLPFNEIKSRIEQQIKVQTIWERFESGEEKWIDERRIEISRIVLSYLQVARKDDMDSYYLIPVWNVCGDMYYHYKDDYPTGQSDTHILDENFERNVWRSRYDTQDYCIVTISAIDGSAVQRYRGY